MGTVSGFRHDSADSLQIEVLERFWSLSQDLLVVKTLSGGWLRASRSLETILGWSLDEVQRIGDAALIHPDDQAGTEDQRIHLTNGEPILRFENRLRHKDGGYRWLSWSARPADGLIYAVARDVTEERAAAAALSRSEERLRLALEAGRIVAWERDLATGHVTRSANAADVTGVASGTREAFEGRIHPDDQDLHLAVSEAALARGTPYCVEVRFLKPDGKLIWLENRGELRIGADGQRHLVGTSTDITAQKRAESEARDAAASLRATLENMDQGLIMVDSQETIRVYNRKVLELLDLPEELMHGPSSYQAVKRYQRERGEFARSDERQRRWLATGDFLNQAVRYERERPNGTVLEVRSTPIPGGGAVRTFTDITARRRIETDLRESEQRFRDYADLAADWLWEVDDQFRITRVTGRRTDAFGQPVADLVGKPAAKILSPHAVGPVPPELLNRIYAREPFENVESRIRQPGGADRCFTSSGRPIFDAAGRFAGFRGVSTDLTDRKAAEMRARETSELLQATLENMDEGLIMVDRDGILQVCNRRATEILDLPPAYTTSKPTFAAFIAHQIGIGEFEGLSEETTPWLKLNGNLLSAPPLYERSRPNGTVLEVRTTHLAGGGAVRTYTDITARRRAETELRREEERYRFLATATNDVIWDWDLVTGRMSWNEALKSVLGYEPSDVVDPHQWWRACLHPADRDKAARNFESTLSGTSSHWEHEYRFRRADGSYAHVFDRGYVMREAGGRPIRLVGALQDLTHRKQLEEQLRQAQKMEAVGQLTGGIAHDFNNLLTVVIGNAEVLTERLSDPEQRKFAAMVLEAAERGAYLTQQLLAFGRRQSLRPQRLSLSEVVDHVTPLLRRTIGEHVELRTRLDAGARCALVDRTLLESALLNLALNARDAMPQGGTLTITTGARVAGTGDGTLPAGQPVVFVVVSDTGTGMPPEVIARAFEPFFTTKEVGKGSGLGLSMVYGFAEQSGGTVSIQSKEGQGTAITIVLPAVDCLDPVEGPTDASVSAPMATHRKRVLVVEDEPQVLRFVSAQLASLGYAVTAVTTGQDALDLLTREEAFDLLFTDVVLPKGMSGVELAHSARQLHPELRVLLTSGYPEESFEHHGRPKDGTRLLRKPYRRKELAESLRSAFET